VCNAPEIESPEGPFLCEVNNANTFRFKANDPNGDPVKFEINWGDGQSESTQFVDSGSEYQTSHTYSQLGEYNITARAVDFHDDQTTLLWSQWSEPKKVLVESEPTPPTEPSISGPTSVNTGDLVSYSAISYDPENRYLIYTFDFGDGTEWSSDLVPSGVSVQCTHTYNTPGTKLLTVSVLSTGGGENENFITISVYSPPSNSAPITPSAPIGPSEAEPGEICDFTVDAIDPEGDEIRYEIDWGDGTRTLTSFISSGQSITVSHQWSFNTIYFIRVRAQDENGLWSSWSTSHEITITDGGPIIVP
jgi:hypothetical protein